MQKERIRKGSNAIDKRKPVEAEGRLSVGPDDQLIQHTPQRSSTGALFLPFILVTILSSSSPRRNGRKK